MMAERPNGRRLRENINKSRLYHDSSSSLLNYLCARPFVNPHSYQITQPMQPHIHYKHMVSPAFSNSGNLMELVCANHGKLERDVNQGAAVNKVLWFPSGRRFLAGDEMGRTVCFDIQPHKFVNLTTVSDSIRCMKWSHDYTKLITGSKTGELKLLTSEIAIQQSNDVHEGAVRELSFAPSDFKFTSCGDDGWIIVWDSATFQPELKLRGPKSNCKISSVDWHPTLGLIASGDGNEQLSLWDPKEPRGHPLFAERLHKFQVEFVNWTNDGNQVICGYGQLLQVFDIRAMKPIQTIKSGGHSIQYTTMTTHPFDDNLFACGDRDGGIAYHQLGEDTPIFYKAKAHKDRVLSLEFNPAGDTLLSGSKDRCVKVWCRHGPGDLVDDVQDTGDSLDIEDDIGLPGAMSASMGMTRSFDNRRGAPGGAGVHPNYRCPACGAIGEHKIGQCPKRQGGKPPPADYICHACGGKGHWIHECKVNKSGGRRQGNTGVNKSGGGPYPRRNYGPRRQAGYSGERGVRTPTAPSIGRGRQAVQPAWQTKQAR
eukprot:TRINITY_DN781780_c0_g1_i1.p1 TRINITY_DN781780_c0_g1~~TRINITY_DN781780_c0_g1_i1.p1  ORF type:complete len:540 (+),score=126.83 TRINITY_DN781780_c0_g1_i1:115-1734(+)